MYYDLHVPWIENEKDLRQSILFVAELGYHVIALTRTLDPENAINAEAPILPFPPPLPIKLVLSRCNIELSKDISNQRISEIRKKYDIISLRPVDEKSLHTACQNLDADIISLDLGISYAFPFKHSTVRAALDRSIKFELAYGKNITSENDISRSVMMQNATSLVRATRGRGVIISSEARNILAYRAPHDLINLGVIFGLKQDNSHEALSTQAKSVISASQLRKKSYRGAVEIVKMPEPKENEITSSKKRKADTEKQPTSGSPIISKKQARKATHKASIETKKTVTQT